MATSATAVYLPISYWIVFGYLLASIASDAIWVAQIHNCMQTSSSIWVVFPEVGDGIFYGLDTLKYCGYYTIFTEVCASYL